jgi:hypothetical protein
MKNAWSLILIELFLFSCKGTETLYTNIDSEFFCDRLNQINSLVERDSVLIDYFSNRDDSDSLIFWKDTLVKKDINPLFVSKITKIHANLNNIDTDSAYNDISKFQYESAKQPEFFRINCIENAYLKKDCNLEIVYWYYPKDNLYLVDVIEILKTPGYRQGYIFLIGFDYENKIIEYDRSYWTE